MKEVPTYTIPDEYLAMEKRSVAPGIEGLKEKLRRDKFIVDKQIRQRRLSPIIDLQKKAQTRHGSIDHLDEGKQVGGSRFYNGSTMNVHEHLYRNTSSRGSRRGSHRNSL